jgi:hypothetical protein
MQGIFTDLTGRIFTNLLVLGRAPKGKSYDSKWECICRCGTPRIVYGLSLKNGTTKSCRCYAAERMRKMKTTHGMSRHKNPDNCREYVSWLAAKGRCFNAFNNKYHNYGGRGITMCHKWHKSFRSFYRDMGQCPPNHSIDRINNNGNYSCGKCPQCLQNHWTFNCKWSTPKEQANNRRPRFLQTPT